MPGLRFIDASSPPADPLRADIALFVGFVARRRGVEDGRPVEIGSWEAFDQRFAWDERPLRADNGGRSDTYLGTAVRAFFLEGGRKCWVVSVGSPWPVLGSRDQRHAAALLPLNSNFSALDPSTWRGTAYVLGLPEVSFLSLPDLPDLFAADPPPPRPEPAPRSPEFFIECASRSDAVRHRNLRRYPAPKSDEHGFSQWSEFVARVGELLWHHAREVQLIATVPRAMEVGRGRFAQWSALATIEDARVPKFPPRNRIGSAFVQLVYPWVRRQDGAAVPEDLEPPDGLFIGRLAQNALARGTFQSIAGSRLPQILTVHPELDGEERARVVPPNDLAAWTLEDRISLLGPGPNGVEVLSDVTTDGDRAYQAANVNRLVSSIVRAARLAGELHLFENSGEQLWGRLRNSIGAFLTELWQDGALEGVSATDAFTVRCDRSTMTQADLDSGRMIVTIQFVAASPITEINVVLNLDEAGQVSIERVPREEAA